MANKYKNIAIDAGHGVLGDSGAVGLVVEDLIVSAVAMALQRELARHAVSSFLSRPETADDVRDSLSQRVATSDAGEADLFVSIHANASTPTEEPMGVEVWAISEEGKDIAERVEQALVILGQKSRGVKDGEHLYVLKNTKAVAILIELFFVDSKADVDIWRRTGATMVATAIADAILEE